MLIKKLFLICLLVYIFNKVPIDHIVFFNHISMEQVQDLMLAILNERDHRMVNFLSQTFQYWRIWEKRRGEKATSKQISHEDMLRLKAQKNLSVSV